MATGTLGGDTTAYAERELHGAATVWLTGALSATLNALMRAWLRVPVWAPALVRASSLRAEGLSVIALSGTGAVDLFAGQLCRLLRYCDRRLVTRPRRL